MKYALTIEGLHPVTATWIELQRVVGEELDDSTEDSEALVEEAKQSLDQYAEMFAQMYKVDPENGVQTTIKESGMRLVFDPRKFLAVRVKLVKSDT